MRFLKVSWWRRRSIAGVRQACLWGEVIIEAVHKNGLCGYSGFTIAKAFWKSATHTNTNSRRRPEEKLRGLCILLKPDLETVASPSDAVRTKQTEARLRANPTRPALPTLMLSDVRSLENKLDEIQLSRDCCVFVFTETWLNNKTPDSAIQLHGLTCCRADRDSSLSGKTRGGGLCVYINKEWCNNAAVVTKNCSSLVEFMFVKCRPFYLPWEFTAIVIVAVYIPPCANAKDALRELYSAISEQQTNNPDGFFIIAGDFNHANLKSVLPKFYQHVNFATRGNNTLDFVYTTNKNAYRAEPRPHLGYSDHISVRPLLKLTKPVQKQITVWPDNATSALQDCFQDTDWNIDTQGAFLLNNKTNDGVPEGSRSGVRGAAASLAASSSSTYAALLGDNTARHPGPSAVTGAVLIRTRGVRQLVLRRWTPACMHGEETGPLRRGALGILTAAVMRLHSHQVCLITRRQTWMFRRPSSSSHTPTPVGSLVKGGDYRRGEADS
ncbi:hypothetical protein M9458_054879 [Cirrhinus mrigala]|uniref:Endonuclease/exonuclease/phosphatase domain-containing protein n=1 Tax=Cirrhinus mrigala TaxID=683832 RepID=A0ABD0MLR1_CIRMR